MDTLHVICTVIRAGDGVSTSIVGVDHSDRVTVVTFNIQYIGATRHRTQTCLQQNSQQDVQLNNNNNNNNTFCRSP